MQRARRIALALAGAAAVTVALAACGGSGSAATSSTSGSATGAATTAASTTAHATSAAAHQSVSACLRSNGVPQTLLPAGLGLRDTAHAHADITGVSTGSLIRVGARCDPSLTRRQFLDIAAVELCLRDDDFHVAHHGTPLADLMALTSSSRLRRAIEHCQHFVNTPA